MNMLPPDDTGKLVHDVIVVIAPAVFKEMVVPFLTDLNNKVRDYIKKKKGKDSSLPPSFPVSQKPAARRKRARKKK